MLTDQPDVTRASSLRLWVRLGGILVLAAGVGAWSLSLTGADTDRAWRALLINFVYFTPLAAGMVVWPAVIMIARGKWMGDSRRSALAALPFAPLSVIVLIILWAGRAHWAAWLRDEHLHNAAWLNEKFLFTRDAAALVVFWTLAACFVRRARHGEPKVLAAWLTLTYCIVFSLIGFDMVMALDPHWFSTLFGGYFFISSLYSALAAWTLAVLLRGEGSDKDRLHDLGMLIVAFSLLTTYMMFSQLIVIWYENLPEEVRFVIPRLRLAPWRSISLGLLAVVYLGPLVLLLVRRSKESRGYLGAVSLAILVGMWAERWWLVTPTLGGRMTIGLAEISLTAAFAAALVLCMSLSGGRPPVRGPAADGEAQS